MSPPSERLLRAWAAADAVCFDVDSTVCVDEGLDNLAEFCGVAAKVKELTNKAMEGGMSFEESFSERLNILRVTRRQLQQFVEANPPKLTPGVKELVQELHRRGKQVYLITGGIFDIVLPVATELGVPADRVLANRLLFDSEGAYSGYDTTSFTCRSGGKAAAVRHVREAGGFASVAMIGDGVTDMEARVDCQLFVGFGGNVVRQQVRDGADWFVKDFDSLIKALGADSNSNWMPADS